MSTKVVTPDKLGKALNDILERFDKSTIKDADAVVREYAKNMFGTIIEKTPVGDFDGEHEGTLKGGWLVTAGAPGEGFGTRDATRTRESLSIPKLISKTGTRSLYLTNNLPYVNVVEYGGYPQTVKRGTFNKKTGKYQVRSSGGFSKQAPKGMVRITMRKRKRFLEVAANKVL
tara:strand:- start:277 stop:795 length:519 start_codon:yes stop_codon:yes gene_type:complete